MPWMGFDPGTSTYQGDEEGEHYKWKLYYERGHGFESRPRLNYNYYCYNHRINQLASLQRRLPLKALQQKYHKGQALLCKAILSYPVKRRCFRFVTDRKPAAAADFKKKEEEDIRGEMTTTPDDTSCECSEGTLSCPYRYVKIDSKYYLRDTTYYDVNNKYCHDCGILNAKGNTHHPGCNMEICPACGAQLAFDDMHDEILVSDELPEGAKLTPAKYDAEFRKEQEKIRKWQIEEFSKVISKETTAEE